ncbi:hypothetical protein [Haloarcula laminariae]|uniref:hypothetical protein n=1 Tax=Haloarcula laminariae TaxID=2961577 RepID=UPI0021C7370D|nr:hypothetical protein [Halomicroarcula laminariae]
MEIVVEDPQRTGGITTYQPAQYSYDGETEMWSLRLTDGGREVERLIPRERVVYIEDEPVTDR